MMLVIVPMIFVVMSIVLYLLTYLFPIFKMIGLDWIALFVMLAPYLFVMFRLSVAKTWKQTDRIPAWKHLINYMRRDNEIIPIEGERAYPGESFLDVQHIGLIEFLGRDCVYNWGDKKVLWGLENINFTPDPRYSNLTHLLWKLGFRNSEDVKNVLTGKDLDLMGKVYINMCNGGWKFGGEKLVEEMKEYDDKIVDFKPVGREKAVSFIDNLSNKRIKLRDKNGNQ